MSILENLQKQKDFLLSQLKETDQLIKEQEEKSKKWEPPLGSYAISPTDCITKFIFDYKGSITRLNGFTRKTEELAEKDLKEIILHARILAYRAEFDPDFGKDISDKHYVYYSRVYKKCKVSNPTTRDFMSGVVYMSKKCADRFAEDLNEGRFEI